MERYAAGSKNRREPGSPTMHHRWGGNRREARTPLAPIFSMKNSRFLVRKLPKINPIFRIWHKSGTFAYNTQQQLSDKLKIESGMETSRLAPLAATSSLKCNPIPGTPSSQKKVRMFLSNKETTGSTPPAKHVSLTGEENET